MPEAFAAARTIESPSCFNVANSTSNPNVSQEFTKNHFSYGETREPINGYIAATDGIFDLLFQQDQINAESTHALIDCLRRQEPTQAAKELTAFCQSGTIARFTRDDLTLILGLRERNK